MDTVSLSATIGDADPRQLVVHAVWSEHGLRAHFADGYCARVTASAVLPGHASPPSSIQVSGAPPHGVTLLFGLEQDFLPWDYLRGHGDALCMETALAQVAKGRAVVGRKVEAARRRAGMTQAAVAKAAGVSRATQSRLENQHGGVTLPTLDRIARAIGVRLIDVLGPEADANDPQRAHTLTNVQP